MQLSRIQLLKTIKLCYPFNLLDDAIISEMIDASKVLFYEKDNLIYQKGSSASHIYLILEGTVSILLEHKQKMITINSKEDFGIIGEEALGENRKRKCTARVEKNLMVLQIPMRFIDKIRVEKPEISSALKILKYSFDHLADRKQTNPGGETIAYFGKPHPIQFIGKLLVSLLFFVAIFLSVFFLSTKSNSQNAFQIGIHIFLVFSFCGLNFWKYLEWRMSYRLVTNKRTFSRQLRLFHLEAISEIPLTAIMNIRLLKPLAGQIFNFGHLSIRTYTGESQINYLPLADQVQGLIESLIQTSRANAHEMEQEVFKKILLKKSSISDDPQYDSNEGVGIDQKPDEVNGQNAIEITYRTHWIILARKVLLPTSIFVMTFLISGFLFFNNIISYRNPVVYLTLFVLLSSCLVWWIYQYFDWYNDKFVINEQQIIDINQRPFGQEERRTASLFNIQAIRFERKGIFGLLLDFGTVYIRVGDEEFTFDHVHSPALVQQMIFQVLENSIAGKKRMELTEQQVRLADMLETFYQLRNEEGKGQH